MNRAQHKQIYLLVYPQTDAHAGSFVCGGGLDLGLSESGIEEARKISRRFKKNPLKVKRIIGSPELRAVQMADILHDEVKVKLVLWQSLADQFLGAWEGKPLESGMDFSRPPQGEKAEAFAARIESAVMEIMKMEELCFVVTHPRVAQKFLDLFGLSEEKIEPAVVYSLDLPAGEGQGHLRVI